MTESALCRPLVIGGVTLPGRVIKTATAETLADDDGGVTDGVLGFYAPLAWAQTPLIITGNLYVHRGGKSSPGMLGIDSDDKVRGLARLTSLVHGHGGLIVAQLNHCGRQVIPKPVGIAKPVSASAVQEKLLGTRPRPMATREVVAIRDAFVGAALRAKAAGFDGVQIHAAHGYLLNQFLTPYTNRRRDEYGGSFHNRVRLARDVIAEVRRAVGAHFPILVKINGDDLLPLRRGNSVHDCVRIARILEQAGADAFEVSVGHYESGPAMVRGTFDQFFAGLLHEGMGKHLGPVRGLATQAIHPALSRLFGWLWPPSEGYNLAYSRAIRDAVSVPVICAGGFHTAAAITSAIESKACDAVSCGRAMIADPLLWKHLVTGTRGPVCTFCNGCIGRAGARPVDCYDEVVGEQKRRMLASIPEAAIGGPLGSAANPARAKETGA